MCVYAGICGCEPGSNERVTLGGAAEALFAFRQRGIQEQVSVGQHSQNWFLRTLGHLRTCTFVAELKKSFKLTHMVLYDYHTWRIYDCNAHGSVGCSYEAGIRLLHDHT